ncbi:hypothetical protein PsYK624_084160 [Phanerochaete sordida]|uniref:RING-type domain-containing protein n=1 Tax=Phanerochaete sordida TaxID=48140 RepID=A0A9P3LFQ6_9APHY|nr:hypothetical protein PsYK624_084160 [Phanerochaete sordida]
MPPARTDSRHGSRQPSQRQPTPPKIDPEIIILSSDDDEPAPPRAARKKTVSKQRGKAKLRPAPVPVKLGEVVELSSEDDPPQRDPIDELKRQLAHAKYELEQLKRVKTTPAPTRVAPLPADVLHKLNRLEMECAAAKASNKKLLDTLDEQLSCDMCYEKMYQPYSLQCGHTFCRGCLQTWFTSELAKYMGQNPGYNPQPNLPRQFREHLQRRDLAPYERTHMMRQIQRYYDAVVHPDYTCPSCRKSVTAKPIEAFTVKNIVAAVVEVEAADARAQGKHVASPRRAGPSRARENNPFGGFFPSAADYLEGLP